MRTAAARLAVWKEIGGPVSRISINAAPQNLAEPDFVDRLTACLREHGLQPADMELEFTETSLARDGAFAFSQLRSLRDMGMGVAIDDFGTGFSSLSYLKNLPATVVKIDRSFVSGLERDERDRILVRNVIGLAHDLGYRVVAEGIETETAFGLLKEWGCDEGQGYWIGKPMSAEALAAWSPP